MIAQARLGVVIPGNVKGVVTPGEHNLGDSSAESPYTSWSYTLAKAKLHAFQRGPSGVVLRLHDLPSQGEAWSWHLSPDRYYEDELLLRGIRIDAEVIA